MDITLGSAVGGPSHVRKMFKPLMKGTEIVHGLIYRRYKPPTKPDQSDAWTVPDDRKINARDLNEPDPTEATGTMGTIPGPVLELSVGEELTVHFRNMDQRTKIELKKICFPLPPFNQQICIDIPLPVPLPIEKRLHSIHPHGVVFENTADGAYPLSPPDTSQPIPASEAAAWASVPKFTGNLPPHTAARVRGGQCASGPAVYPGSSSYLNRIAGRKWLALGDAACTWDPLSSQGIAKALRSSQAAAAIAGHFAGDANAVRDYAAQARDNSRRYAQVRQYYYRREQRWPASLFWKRRQASHALLSARASSPGPE